MLSEGRARSTFFGRAGPFVREDALFTGLVQHLGRIEGFERGSGAGCLRVDLGPLADGLALGGSVAIDGVCLSATELVGSIARFDVLSETLSRSTLGSRRQGDRVNLETSLRVGDPVGGHFVQGHVDGIGTVRERRDLGGQWEFTLAAPETVLETAVEKGSIAVDGISLTIARLSGDRITVAVISETYQRTTMGLRHSGDPVNLEADILGKVVARLLGRAAPGGLSADKLREAGW
jgi:riboflavin synthase